MSVAGEKADAILDWVYEDPETRAAEGLKRVNALAARTSDVASLREIQDVGAVLARLADV